MIRPKAGLFQSNHRNRGVPDWRHTWLHPNRVAILNLDEYGEIGSRSAETDFPLIHGLVRRGLERFGEFALFWNQDLDSVSRRRQNRGEALRRLDADFFDDADRFMPGDHR